MKKKNDKTKTKKKERITEPQKDKMVHSGGGRRTPGLVTK